MEAIIGAVLCLVSLALVIGVIYVVTSLRQPVPGSAVETILAMNERTIAETLTRFESGRESRQREEERERRLRERERDMARRERELELQLREYDVESTEAVLTAACEADRMIEEARRQTADRRPSTLQASTAGSTLVH